MDLGALLAQLKERFDPADFRGDANDPRNGETIDQTDRGSCFSDAAV